MIKTPLKLKGLHLIETEPFKDHRGQFARLFCVRELEEIGLDKPIVQINHSVTRTKGAIRGMHFQLPPHAEIKIVRCIRGACFDVAVDMRKDSNTYLQWHGEILTESNNRAMYIPEGFAHGFQAMEPDTELLYLHTEFYTQGSEDGVGFDDPAIGIQWLLPPTDISEKDKKHKRI